MVQGAVDNATGFVAFALESTSGTPKAAPQTSPNGHIVLRGDMAPETKKPAKFEEIGGQIFPTLPTPGGESFSMSLPMFPILSGNGLGPLIAALLGDDTLTALVADHVQQHILDWETLIKTLTLFCHYGTTDDDQYRMCAVDSLDIKSESSDNSLKPDFKLQGASMEHLTSGAVATNLFIDPDSASQLSHSGLLLEWGQPGAAARDLCESLTTSLKRNLAFGSLSRPGQHPAGSSSHNVVNSKKSNCDLKLDFIDTDREEIQRAMWPVNTDPAASTRFADVVRYLKVRASWYGAMLYAGVHGEADYNNAGTAAATFAGTYSNGDVVTVGEIEMSDSNIYETSLGTNKDLAFKLLDVGATYEVETGSALAVSVVSKDVKVTLGTGGSTAAAILAKILDTPAAVALLTPSLANGSTGAGTVTLAQAKITSTSFVDGFRYRYTTGGAWSAWTAWIKVTKAAQTIVSAMTVTFDDDDITKAGDIYRFCSHYREMLRVTYPVMAYTDVPKTTFKDGRRMISIDLAHTSADAADRPFITIISGEAVAFDTV
jgi:hypothetical protein